MIYNAEAVLRFHGLEKLAGYEFRHLRAPRHIDYDHEHNGEANFMVCRVCGTKIAGWTDDDVREQRVDKINETQSVTKFIMRQKFRRFPNCGQARLVLENGSLYEPLLCRDCVAALTTEVAQECFIADLIEMVGQAMASGRTPDRAVDVVKALMELRVVPAGVG